MPHSSRNQLLLLCHCHQLLLARAVTAAAAAQGGAQHTAASAGAAAGCVWLCVLTTPRFTRPLTRCMKLRGGDPSGGSGAGTAPWPVVVWQHIMAGMGRGVIARLLYMCSCLHILRGVRARVTMGEGASGAGTLPWPQVVWQRKHTDGGGGVGVSMCSLLHACTGRCWYSCFA